MAAGRVANLDPARHVLNVAGVKIDGYAPGSYVTVSQVSPAFNEDVGSDGEVARVKSNDRRGKVIIKLLQTSLSNDYLSGLHQTDLDAPNGAGVFTFGLTDLDGTTVAHGDKCWIVQYPDGDEDRSPKSREWEIRVGSMDRFVGGNAS